MSKKTIGTNNLLLITKKLLIVLSSLICHSFIAIIKKTSVGGFAISAIFETFGLDAFFRMRSADDFSSKIFLFAWILTSKSR